MLWRGAALEDGRSVEAPGVALEEDAAGDFDDVIGVRAL